PARAATAARIARVGRGVRAGVGRAWSVRAGVGRARGVADRAQVLFGALTAGTAGAEPGDKEQPTRGDRMEVDALHGISRLAPTLKLSPQGLDLDLLGLERPDRVGDQLVEVDRLAVRRQHVMGHLVGNEAEANRAVAHGGALVAVARDTEL